VSELNELMQNAVSTRDFQIMDEFIIPNLNTLNILGFIPPERLNEFSEVLGGMYLEESFFSEEMQNLLLQRAEILGADSSSGLMAVFEINDNIYLLSIELIEYNGKWYIIDFGGLFFSALGIRSALIPVTYFGEEYGFYPDRLREMLQNNQ